MLHLKVPTDPRWASLVIENFDSFLGDHALNERKAAASAMAMVAHYPDRKELVEKLVDLAREELDHFQRVYAILQRRGTALGPDQKDPYVGLLLREIRKDTTDHYFMDRLLVAAVVEARGCERFSILASALTDPDLATFYAELASTEARHHSVFAGLARTYLSSVEVGVRLEELFTREAEIIGQLVLRPCLH